MRASKLFLKMRPSTNDVWELNGMDDLRFFGWFPKIDNFVAVNGGFFGDLKEDKSLYEKHRLEVIAYRNNIDLDEPKFMPGAREEDVVSE